jgi:hypothetical protein
MNDFKFKKGQKVRISLQNIIVVGTINDLIRYANNGFYEIQYLWKERRLLTILSEQELLQLNNPNKNNIIIEKDIKIYE